MAKNVAQTKFSIQEIFNRIFDPEANTIDAGSSGLEYNATPPTATDGSTGAAQGDMNRNTKVAEQFQPVYEDNTNGKAVTEQRYAPFAAISTATTTVLKSSPGYVDELRVIGGTLGNVTIYDNTAASGTVLLPAVTPVANGVLLKHITFGTGLTVVTASATVIVGSGR